MNYIFNSDKYLNFVSEADSNVVKTKTTTKSETTGDDTSTNSATETTKQTNIKKEPTTNTTDTNVDVESPTPKKETTSDPNLDAELDPNLDAGADKLGDEMPTDAETDEVSFSEKKNNFQKYILYYKLRQLEYKLSNYKVLQTYKNVKDVKDFLVVLNNFLLFYDAFDYKEASNLSIQILDKFKKIK